jgi:hypothetical protein
MWIPFLTRMIVMFTAAVTTAVFHDSDMSKAQAGLDMAIVLLSGIRGDEGIHER